MSSPLWTVEFNPLALIEQDKEEKGRGKNARHLVVSLSLMVKPTNKESEDQICDAGSGGGESD